MQWLARKCFIGSEGKGYAEMQIFDSCRPSVFKCSLLRAGLERLAHLREMWFCGMGLADTGG